MTQALVAFRGPIAEPVIHYNEDRPGEITHYTYCRGQVNVLPGWRSAIGSVEEEQERDLAILVGAAFWANEEIGRKPNVALNVNAVKDHLAKIAGRIGARSKREALFLSAVRVGILGVVSFGSPGDFPLRGRNAQEKWDMAWILGRLGVGLTQREISEASKGFGDTAQSRAGLPRRPLREPAIHRRMVMLSSATGVRFAGAHVVAAAVTRQTDLETGLPLLRA